ncbi:MAG: mannose-1-phosphate guanylyltransferase [Bacteroidales bacterium]|nr:mannose-1-phosphate guanylyltransferase [Bacteroidales bacterium]
MKNNADFHLVIMAGGVGSRFWPMSRPENPKQFIDVLGVGRSLLQLTVDRFGSAFTPEHTWVVTSEKYADKVKEQLPDLPESNILLEPCMRNTTPCIAYVAWKIFQRYPNATMVVSPADHFVADVDKFRKSIAKGLEFVAGQPRVLTLGMTPTRPDTGYGYIQAVASADADVLHVSAFREKPTLDVAKGYLEQGGFYWNAGIFLWDVRTAMAAIRHFEPEIASVMDKIKPSLYTPEEQQTVSTLFPECKNISIDYAVMERLAGHNEKVDGRITSVFVLPASFGWSDLGTWGSLYAQLDKDLAGNAVVGDAEVSLVESWDCMVRTSGNVRFVIQGLQGFIVAEDNGTVLICKRDDEQRIKQFSATLKE